MSKKQTMPILIKKGDKRLKINGKSPLVDCRVIGEDLYQKMLKSFQPPVYKGAKEAFKEYSKLASILDNENMFTYANMIDFAEYFTHQTLGKGIKVNVFLREKGLNHDLKLEGGNFNGTLLELLSEYKSNPEPRELPTDKLQQEKYAELRERHGMFKAIPLFSKWLEGQMRDNPMQQGGEHVCANFMDKQGICCVCEKQGGEWTQDRVRKAMDELGFDFPETEEQLKAFDEKFKDYPHKLTGNEIDPHEILNKIKPPFYCAEEVHNGEEICESQCETCKKVQKE